MSPSKELEFLANDIDYFGPDNCFSLGEGWQSVCGLLIPPLLHLRTCHNPSHLNAHTILIKVNIPFMAIFEIRCFYALQHLKYVPFAC